MSLNRRLVAGLLLAVILAAGLLPATAGAAPRAVTSDQERVAELVNEARAANGRSQLSQANLTFNDRAQAWAQELARCRCLKHRNGPYGAPAGWYAAAENVGRGWSFAQVQQAFMRSPGHRENILTRRFTHIGTGVAYAPNGEMFVVQAFMDRTP